MKCFKNLQFCSLATKPDLTLCFLTGLRTLDRISSTEILMGSGFSTYLKYK